MLDDAGRAVGIVITNLPVVSETRLAQNVNYALKAPYVRALIDALPDIGGYSPPVIAASRAAAIRNEEASVFLILAEKPAPAEPAAP